MTQKRFVETLRAAVLIGLWLVSVPALFAQQLAVEPTGKAELAHAAEDVLRRSAVRVDQDPIHRAALSTAASDNRIELELFDRRRVSAVAEHVDYPLPGTMTWAGRVEGEPESRAIFSVTGDRVDGAIYLEDGIYEVRSEGESHVLVELDPAKVHPRDCIPESNDIAKEATTKSLSRAGTTDDGSVIDVMIGYSPQAAEGREASLRNRIALGIEVSNDIYRRSGINTELRLAYSGLIDLDEDAPQYVNTGLFLLTRLVDPDDGFYDDVHPLRDQFAADMVVALVDDLEPRVTGQAAAVMEGSNNTAFESQAFAVLRWQSAGSWALTHELGHLMGSHHDRGSFTITVVGQGPPTTGAFPFSFAYVPPGEQFKTVMASGASSPLNPILQFSNPGLFVNGVPAGAADADNARSIEAVRGVVANFRPSDMGCGRPNGASDFCAVCGRCAAGHGDCDSDAECAPGLECVDNVGPDFGFGAAVDVCLPVNTPCQRQIGDPAYCLDPACGPCSAGEGDCDPNQGQCLPGLVCSENVGANYGLHPNIDVCENPGGVCTLAPGDPNFCLDPACGPCSAGEGDCDPNQGQCRPGLVCSEDVGPNYGFGAAVDVCEHPMIVQDMVLAPTGDAFVANDWPDSNFGSEIDLRIRYAGGDGLGHPRFSFLRFDVPTLPRNVASATLRLRTQNVAIGEAGIYSVDLAPWSESQITWNNWGDPGQATPLGSVLNLPTYTWIDFDVTSAVTASGTVTFGLAAGGSSDFGNQDFYSRESLYPPQLVIRFE